MVLFRMCMTKLIGRKRKKENYLLAFFQILHTSYFKNCLKEAFQNNNSAINNFYYAIMEYSKKYPFEDVENNELV